MVWTANNEIAVNENNTQNGSEIVAEGDKVSVTCGASKFIYDRIEWYHGDVKVEEDGGINSCGS